MCLGLYGHGLLVDFALLSWSGCTMSLWVGISWKWGKSVLASLQPGQWGSPHPGGATSESSGGHSGGHCGGFPFLVCG